MKFKPTLTAIGLFLGASVSAPVFAQQAACKLPTGLYAVAVTSGTQCGTFATNTAQGLFDKINSTSSIQSILPGYTSNSVATATARFNGIDLTLSFPGTGTTVTLNIPALSYSKSFTGTSRENSASLLIDDLKLGDIVGRIMNYQARSTPTSPITGVGGLVPAVVSQEFNQNFTESATNVAAPPAVMQGTPSGSSNLVNASISFGQFSTTDALGTKSQVKITTLPLSYTLRNDLDPRRQLQISLPLSQADVNGAKSYSGGFGLAYRLPINDNWTLVPSGRISGVGSLDLATVAGVSTVGLTSVYMWELGNYNIAMGNMLNMNASMKFKSGSYAFDPGVRNTVMRNGLLLSQPVMVQGSRMSMEYSIIDTRYLSGVKPYISNYQEIGVTLGTNKSALTSRSFLRAGLSYTTGRGTNGWTANVGYWF